LIILIAAKLNGQSCLPNGIVFTSQYAIDNFSISYPGCTQIAGDVIINGSSITNLNGLSQLVSINGNVDIVANPLLNNLNGLSNLSSIGGYFDINSNSSLSSVSGLSNLTSVGFYFSIFNNPDLLTLNGIENLNYVGSTFVIQENELLTDISAISSTINLVSTLSIRNNSNLANCNAEAVCNLIGNSQVWEVYGNATGCNSIPEIESNCSPELIVSTSSLQFGNVTVGSSSQIGFSIYNPENQPITVYSISYPAGFSGDWNGGVINGGDQVFVSATFQPTQPISYFGTISIYSNSSTGLNTISCGGNGIAPVIWIGLSNSSLSFGNIQVGSTGQQTYTIYCVSNGGNGSTQPLIVSSINYPPGFSGNWNGGTINIGQNKSVTVTFNPTQATNYSGTITINSNSTTGSNTLSCEGNGTVLPSSINVSGNLSFGDVNVGSTSQQSMSITNTSSQPLMVSSINYPPGFSGSWNSGTIAPGVSQVVTVTFAPIQAVSYFATITVNSNATSGTNTINCSGNGISQPTSSINVTGNLSFGNVNIGSTAQQSMSITNTSSQPLVVSSINYPTGFSGSWNSGTIAPGVSQVVTVTFAPIQAVSYFATITVNSNATSGTNSINCSGNGINQPASINVSGNLLFGNVNVGLTGQQSMSITNTSSQPLVVSSITYPTGFSGSWNNGTIAPGLSQVVAVTFAPTQAVSYVATITVNSNATSGTTSINCIGVGAYTISNPTLAISNFSIAAGQSIGVSGFFYTPLNIAYIDVVGNNGQHFRDSLIVNVDKSIDYTFHSPSTWEGEYWMTGTDKFNNLVSLPKYISIVQPISQNVSHLTITSQQNNATYEYGVPVNVDFFDVLQADYAQYVYPMQSNSANRLFDYEISYKVGVNGIWQPATTVTGSGLLNSNISFSNPIVISSTDPFCKIRIKDTYAPTNVVESNWFEILPVNTNTNIRVDKLFDFSFPTAPLNVQGVAADGVARIYVKIKKENQGTGAAIQTVSVSLEDGINTSTSLLGKIQKATEINSYSLEANNANSTTASNSSPVNNEFWFWYVAPDDFTELGSNQLASASERIVKLNFTVTFADGSTQNKSEDLKIVRPPLVMVHGLASSAEAFDGFKYSIGSGAPLSYQQFISSPLFKQKKALTLIPDAPFAVNANILLSPTMNGNNINSLQRNIDELRLQGYACNQVDYVCHSMGGCVLRTAMATNQFYGIGGASNDIFKSYGKGFVHKLITINTPHEGSPAADLVNDFVSNLPFSIKLFLSNLFYTSPNDLPFSFIRPLNPNIFPFPWKASYAVSDLQINNSNGGVNLEQTNIKHHFIVGDLNLNNLSELSGWENYNTLIKELLNVANLELEQYMSQKGYLNYLGDSDGIVPIKSQLAGALSSPTNSTIFNSTSLINANHVQITDRLDVGNSVKLLLDESIFSPTFGDIIPATQNLTGGGDENKTPKNIHLNFTQFDTSKVVIDYPIRNQALVVDSLLTIRVRIKDTIGLQYLQVVFQDQIFTSQSTDSIQTFSLQISPNLLGNRLVVAQATYDVFGSTDYFVDTLTANVVSNAQISGFQVSPEVKSVYSNIPFYPDYKAVYDAFIAKVPHNDPDISVVIANPSIVSYNNIDFSFSGLVSGSTFAEISFKGYKDTIYINVLGDTTSTTSIHEFPKPEKPVIDIALSAYPNPTSGVLNVTYDLPIKSNVRIALVNSTGQMRNLGYFANQVQGRHDRLIYLPSDLSNGIYYLQASTQFGNYSISIVYNK